MANRATTTYNGKTISTEDKEGSFEIKYNGKTLSSIGAGVTKTIKCAGKIMQKDIVIGGKTLLCAMKKMATDIVVAVESLFPSAPSTYSLIGKYTTSQTWTAPEDGYFQIEAFGASGNGGRGGHYYQTMFLKLSIAGGGGGGGGGGYACSRVKMKKGDTIVLSTGAVGSNTTAEINSSMESYSTLTVTSGANGTDTGVSSSGATAGVGGSGGVGSGGNYSNKTGGTGGNGTTKTSATSAATGGSGGSTGYSGGNKGGKGGSGYSTTTGLKYYDGAAGSAGFFKIYSGNTNNVITPVNYIQSTGTQFIDTGYTFTSSNIKIQCKWKDNVTSSATVVFGTGKDGTGSTDKGFLAIYEDDLYIGSGSTGFISTLNISDTSVPHEFALEVRSNNTLSYTLDGTTSSGTYTGAINQIYPLYVLNQYPHNTRIRKANLYYFRIYDNDVLIRDFIPCTNASGIAGLYDRVEGKFYGNAGNGSFITG